MGDFPKVSIVLPVHNAAQTIRETLESLRDQSLQEYELLLLDDRCEDESVDIARAIFAHDSRLRVLRVDEPTGLIPALQLGLRESRAPVIARMDADDIALPTRLSKQLACLAREPFPDLVTCQVESFSDSELGGGYRAYDRWLTTLLEHDDFMRERFVESPFAHPSVMFNKVPFVELGGYRELAWPEDYDLWQRAAMAGLRFAKVDEVLLRWRDYPTRTSRRDPRYSPEAFMKCRAHYLARGPLKKAGSVVVWGAGQMGGTLGRLLLNEGVNIRAFVDIDERKIGNLRHGYPVVSPDALSDYPEAIVVACVGSRGARGLIREELNKTGRVEGEHYWCAL